MKRSIRESRVLRARRETTAATDAANRFEANGNAGMARQARAEADRAADAERTAADAPRKTGIKGFGPRAGRGEFRRG